MANIELSISPDYVHDWNLTAAIRELYQNALDQQTVDPDNYLLFTYNPQTLLLSIGNRKSALDVSTLVLGKTSKAKNEAQIGQFGEGYKLALAVLLRLGKTVKIYNNPSVWTPSIKISDTFNVAILNINVVKHRFKECPEEDLIFQVYGVTIEEYDAIVASNRNLHQESDTLDAPQGKLLLDPKYKGQIFVRGLHITTLDKAHYGYDFEPKYIKVGRDRDLINEWDLFYATAQMWAGQAECAELIEAMIGSDAPDIKYINSYVWKLPKETVVYVGDKWYAENTGGYPCANERDAARARSIYGAAVKTVIVSANMMAILKETEQYKHFTKASLVKQKPFELLKKLIKHPDRYRPSVFAELKAMVELSQHWDWKSI